MLQLVVQQDVMCRNMNLTWNGQLVRAKAKTKAESDVQKYNKDSEHTRQTRG